MADRLIFLMFRYCSLDIISVIMTFFIVLTSFLYVPCNDYLPFIIDFNLIQLINTTWLLAPRLDSTRHGVLVLIGWSWSTRNHRRYGGASASHCDPSLVLLLYCSINSDFLFWLLYIPTSIKRFHGLSKQFIKKRQTFVEHIWHISKVQPFSFSEMFLV